MLGAFLRACLLVLCLVFVFGVVGGCTVASPSLGQEPWVWQPEPGHFELYVGNIKNGKSHAARVRTARVRRLLCWDPQGDEPELGQGTVTVHQLERLEHRLVSGALRLAVRPTAWSREDRRAEYGRFARAAWRIGGLCVKSDESGGIAAGGSFPEDLDKIMREGRHRGLSLVMVGQRFTQVPVLIRDNAQRLIVFRHGYDDAGDVAARLSTPAHPVTADQVAGLPPRHFFEWTPIDGALTRPPLGA